jgi:hypothetical protein
MTLGSFRARLSGVSKFAAMAKGLDGDLNFGLYRSQSLQRKTSTNDADNRQDYCTDERQPINYVLSLLNPYFWNRDDRHFVILCLLILPAGVTSIIVSGLDWNQRLRRRLRARTLLLILGIIGVLYVFLVAILKPAQQNAYQGECQIFHGENYTLALPLDQETGMKHGSSYPVRSPKPALGAAFARSRTELCPSKWNFYENAGRKE